MKNTHSKMFADWFKEGQHPEELMLGIPMSIKKEYSEYYKEKQYERMETRKPTK